MISENKEVRLRFEGAGPRQRLQGRVREKHAVSGGVLGRWAAGERC